MSGYLKVPIEGINSDVQNALDNKEDTGVAAALIADLIDSAPGTLDTLNEISAALGDDANLSATLLNAISLKMDLHPETIALSGATKTITSTDSGEVTFKAFDTETVYRFADVDNTEAMIVRPTLKDVKFPGTITFGDAEKDLQNEFDIVDSDLADKQSQIDDINSRISSVDNVSDLDKPISTATQAALDNDAAAISAISSTVFSQANQISANTEAIANKYVLPTDVTFKSANKNYIQSNYDGLMIFSGDSALDVNPAGAYNGSGAGQKAWIGFEAYDQLPLSSFSNISFTAKNFYDAGATAGSPHGNVSWLMYVNFKTTGSVNAADYAGLVIDDTIRNRVTFYALSANHTTYSVTSSDRLVKCVGGTGKLTGLATSTTGSNIISNVQFASQLSVGMYFRQVPASTVGTDAAVSNIPDGAKITAINVAAATVTLDTNVTTGNSSPIANGSVNTTNGSAVATQVTTTGWAVGQAITGTGIPAGTYVTVVTGTSSITMSQQATATNSSVSLTRQAGFTYNQYGGIAPGTRASTANGTTTVTIGARTGDAVVTTADLQVGMQVTGTGVPANSFIQSMVANTSITLNNSVTAGSPTLTFVAVGKTGIPNNSDLVAVPMSVIASNNSQGIFVNTTPTVAGGWSAADNGALLNTQHAAINFVQGNSAITSARTNILKTVVINSDTYNF